MSSKEQAHDTRPALKLGEFLRQSEFMHVVGYSKPVMDIVKRHAEEHGFHICLRIGAKCLIDTSAFVEFLKFATQKKLQLTSKKQPLTSGRSAAP